MMDYIGMFLPILAMMCFLRMLFAEMNGRFARKRQAVGYFLHLEDKFKYRQMPITMIFMAVFFLMGSGLNLFSMEGLSIFLVVMVVAGLFDILSVYLSVIYSRFRFKSNIIEAKQCLEEIKHRVVEPVMPSDIVFEENLRDLKLIAQEYIEPQTHLCVCSHDGGEFLESLHAPSQVTFLIDPFQEEANERFEKTDVRIVAMTEQQQYPFKDGRIDTLVCDEEDFYPQEGHRILKDDGIVILKQKGSENLMEMYAFTEPRMMSKAWNLDVAKEGLQNLGFDIVDGGTAQGTLSFKSVAAFFQYTHPLTHITLDNIRDYLDQYHFIDLAIKQAGSFKMRTHHFYVVARKKANG